MNAIEFSASFDAPRGRLPAVCSTGLLCRPYSSLAAQRPALDRRSQRPQPFPPCVCARAREYVCVDPRSQRPRGSRHLLCSAGVQGDLGRPGLGLATRTHGRADVPSPLAGSVCEAGRIAVRVLPRGTGMSASPPSLRPEGDSELLAVANCSYGPLVSACG